jgi:hypothetical protein
LFLLKKILLFTVLSFVALFSFAQQIRLSIATDLTAQRNFTKEQRYWAFGQTVHAHIHMTSKDGIYLWFTYYSNGKFKNNLVATAKSPATIPQQISYVNNAKMRLKHFSLGYKRYLLGAADSEKGWNFFVFAGFGLQLGRIENTHSVNIDTSLYDVPVLRGKANFKRLTLDPELDLNITWVAIFQFMAKQGPGSLPPIIPVNIF